MATPFTGFQSESDTLNETVFNVPNERSREINTQIIEAVTTKMGDTTTWSELYHLYLIPLVNTPEEELFLAFSFGRLVNMIMYSQ